MSLADLPGPGDANPLRYRGDRALADEIERRGELVTLEATIRASETQIAHGQHQPPVVVAVLPLRGAGAAHETRAPDTTSIYLAATVERSYRVTLLVRRR